MTGEAVAQISYHGLLIALTHKDPTCLCRADSRTRGVTVHVVEEVCVCVCERGREREGERERQRERERERQRQRERERDRDRES